VAGLLVLFLACVWLAAACFIAPKITRRVPGRWRPLCTVAVAAFLICFPFLDELLGAAQFSYYCRDAVEWKKHGTLPVGQELYTPEGKSRLLDGNWSSPAWNAEYSRLLRLREQLVGVDFGVREPKLGLVPIHKQHVRVFARQGDRLLAEWNVYHREPGLLRRTLVEHSSARCEPAIASRYHQELLPFDGSARK
jgi:hypothetical protein